MLTVNKKKAVILVIVVTFLVVVTSCASRNHGMYYQKSPEITFASFSPTGQTFAAVFSWEHINGIILFSHNGIALKWLCKNTKKKYFSEPKFSPDGTKIAYVSGEEYKYTSIYIMDKDGGNIRRLTDSSNQDHTPAFSADGRQVFFSRRPPSDERISPRSDVWCVDLESRKEKRITNYSFARFYSLAVLPDDKHILISGFIKPQFQHLLWKVNIDHPEIISTLIPDLTPFAGQPATRFLDKYEPSIAVPFKGISKDGRFIVFPWSNPEPNGGYANPQAYVTDMTNMKTTMLPSQDYSKSVPIAISPDGRLILINKYPRPTPPFGPIYPNSILYMVNRDGSGLRNLNLDFTAIWPEVLEAKRIHERG